MSSPNLTGEPSKFVDSYLAGSLSFEELKRKSSKNLKGEPSSPAAISDDEEIVDSGDSNDEPSTSVATSSKTPLSASAKRALLSGQTKNLLSDYYDILGLNPGAPNSDEQSIEQNGDSEMTSEIEEDAESDKDSQEETDEEYFPSAKQAKQSNKISSGRKGRDYMKDIQTSAPTFSRKLQPSFDYLEDESEAVVFGLPKQIQSSDKEGKMEWTKPGSGPRKLPFELEALLGQANMVFARGKHDEAIKMVHEVIRQKPQAYTAYEMLAVMYDDMKQPEKHLQYSLMAAYLNGKTPGEEWTRLAELCQSKNMIKQAVACFTRAIAAEPDIWKHYEDKLQLLGEIDGSDRAILDTYKKAVTGLKDCQDRDFYVNLVSNTVQKYLDIEEVDGAIKCLGPLVDKMHLEKPNEPVDSQYLLLYSTLLCETQCYFMAARTILVNGCVSMLKDEIVINDQIMHQDKLDELLARNGDYKISYKWPKSVEPIFKARLAVALIGMDRHDLCQDIVVCLIAANDVVETGEAMLACIDALFVGSNYTPAEIILKTLIESTPYEKDSEVWLKYAECLSAIGKLEPACEAFSRVVELAPAHVDARISLSALQQRLGRSSQALETLMDEADDSDWPADERLLYQKCQVLHAQKDMIKFLKGSRRLLAPYFYEMYSEYAHGQPKSRPRTGIFMSVRSVIFEVVRGSNLERLVKSVGPKLDPTLRCLSAQDIHMLCFQNAEVLFESGRMYDMILFCAYAAICPILNRCELWRPFERMLLLACLKARMAAKLAFSIIRYGYSKQLEDDDCRTWNLIGMVLMIHQDVRYHRFLLRASSKQPQSMPLSLMNGNCSLISGTYPHAIAEYVSGLEANPADPLLNLLAAVSFLAVSCKKFILKRHQVLVEALAFMSRYEQARGKCQETFYNLGRALHQANILPGAIHFYRKAIDCEAMCSQKFDLKRHAAHNLALIYKSCGDLNTANELLYEFCKV